MQPASSEQLAAWDDLVKTNPDGGNVLQLRAFGETKQLYGWQPQYLMVGKLAVMALTRQIPLLGKYWYIPKGPGVSNYRELKSVLAKLSDADAFAIRLDPELTKDKVTAEQLSSLGLVSAPRDIQYNVNTIVVDLKPSEEEILAGFKQKTRYNVRLAAKKGVIVEAVDTSVENIDVMYELTRAMTERAGVYLRDKQYFTDFYLKHSQSGNGQMFFAYYEGKVLAGAYVTFVDCKALYKDGGSVREHSEVQAPYGLQWEVMRWLKERGVTEYDLHGVPPADQLSNPSHPLAGLARFKTGFNQDIVEFIGTYDLPLDQVKYFLWKKAGERLVNAYEHRTKSRLFY